MGGLDVGICSTPLELFAMHHKRLLILGKRLLILIAGDLAVEFPFNKLMRRVESTAWALELLVAAAAAARTLLNYVLKLILSLSLDTNDPIEVSDQLR